MINLEKYAKKRFNSTDYTIFKYATLLMFILFIPFNIIHEVGHLIPCWLNGFEGTLSVGIITSQAICYDMVSNSVVFSFAGGFLASILAVLILTIKKINRHPALVISLSSFSVAHFFNAVIEAFANDWYMNSEFAVPIVSFGSFMIFLAMLIIFGRKYAGSKPLPQAHN